MDSIILGDGSEDDPRKYSMSNMTPGACTLPQPSHRRASSQAGSARSTSEGLFSSTRTRQFSTHDRLFQTVEPEPGQRSRRLFTNKPDRTLYVDDIEGARARRAEFHTERVVNPLEPKYKLPSCEVLPPPVPKFIRDNINVDDIEGTKPLPLYPWRQRDTHSVDDIEGAKAGWKPRYKLARKQGEPRDYMDVSDISSPKKKFERDVNSLQPRYEIHGLVIEDDPVKTKPKPLPKGKNTPYFSLYTADIEGAQPGWIPEHKIVPKTERITNNTKDIPGAQADTLKRVLHTQRQVNPLDPVYTSLDGYPLESPFPRFFQPDAAAPAPAVSQATPQTPSEPPMPGRSAHPSERHSGQQLSRDEETNGARQSSSDTGVVVPMLSEVPQAAAPFVQPGIAAHISQRSGAADFHDLPDDPLAGVEAIHERVDTLSMRLSTSVSARSTQGDRQSELIAQPTQKSSRHTERVEALRPAITERSQDVSASHMTLRASASRPPAPRSAQNRTTPRTSSLRVPGTPQSLPASGGWASLSGRKMSTRSFTAAGRSRSGAASQRSMSLEEKKYLAELQSDIAAVRALA